jgi:hypothetical protein
MSEHEALQAALAVERGRRSPFLSVRSFLVKKLTRGTHQGSTAEGNYSFVWGEKNGFLPFLYFMGIYFHE